MNTDACKPVGDGADKPSVQLRDEDDEPYCRECGSEDLAYLEQYANGSEYRCRVCGTVQMW